MSLLEDKSQIHPDTHEHLAYSLETMVASSTDPEDPTLETSAVVPAHHGVKRSWFASLFDPSTFTKLFAAEHLGVFVITDRTTGSRQFESMPLYVRVGMHLLFFGQEQTKLLRWHSVEELLKQQSIKQGRVYDETNPEVVLPHIESFISAYSINTEELAIQDLSKYKTFNQFFARSLKPGSRVIANPEDPHVITSAADARLTVFKNVESAKKFWVKGRDFSISSLLDHNEEQVKLFGNNPSLAIFRLAPQDYHRFHSPADGILGDIKHIPGQYYTVNATVVNENFDVFTANRRDIVILESNILTGRKTPIGLVAIGALLVGSIHWANASGTEVKKGDDAGWFQYGGSTFIAIFPEDVNILWDEDLLKASESSIETVVKVGERIGEVGA